MTQIIDLQSEFAAALDHIKSANEKAISAIEDARSEQRGTAKDDLKDAISAKEKAAAQDLAAFEAVKAERDAEIDALYDNIKGGEGSDLSYNFAATRARIVSEGTEVQDALDGAADHASAHVNAMADKFSVDPEADFNDAFDSVFGAA